MQLRTVDEAFDLVATRGDGAYGLAGVTQLEHALQSAHLAAQEGRGDELTIAALLHDIGHFAIDHDIDLASEGVDEDAFRVLLLHALDRDVLAALELHEILEAVDDLYGTGTAYRCEEG